MVKPLELEVEVDISQDIKNLIDEVPEEPVLEQKLENEKDVEKAEPTPNQIKVQKPRKKRGNRQSKNENPFRIIDDSQSGTDDDFQYPDDFRFGE